MSTLKTEKREKNYHHGDLHSAIVDVATRMLEEHGPEKLSLREAARLLDVSPAAPYRHFPSKEALLSAVAARGFTMMNERFEEIVGQVDRSPVDRLFGIGHAYIEFAVARPQMFRLLFGGGIADWDDCAALKAEGDRGFMIFLDAIVCAQAAGEVAAGPPDQIASTLWAMVHGYASLILVGVLESEKSPCTLDRNTFFSWIATGVRI